MTVDCRWDQADLPGYAGDAQATQSITTDQAQSRIRDLILPHLRFELLGAHCEPLFTS
jgi:hypothetical protein